MGEIGLFFSSSTGNSETIARRIASYFLPVEVDFYDIIHIDPLVLSKYDNLIFGIPTWNLDSLHTDWEEFLPKLQNVILKKKKVALFGLGDQKIYSDNFVDDMGRLYDWLVNRKVRVVGYWSKDGYFFKSSFAFRNKQFVGLALDEDNQSHLSEFRIEMWVKQLKEEFLL